MEKALKIDQARMSAPGLWQGDLECRTNEIVGRLSRRVVVESRKLLPSNRLEEAARFRPPHQICAICVASH